MTDKPDLDKSLWFVRAGRGARYVDELIDDEIIAIGWTDIGAVAPDTAKDEIRQRLEARYPDKKPGTITVWAGQLYRFCCEMQVGDLVATYDPNMRQYFIGTVASTVRHRDHHLGHVRDMDWQYQVARDRLSQTARNGLGSIATLFVPRDEVKRELLSLAVPLGEEQPDADEEESVPVQPPSDAEDTEDDREALSERSARLIEDLLARLGWEDMERLVAGILRGMGYRTRLTGPGADRGVDIFASPDGLGLEEPRIFVEVKHRRQSMGAQEIRAFLGGRNAGDRCLYVSTGGFTKDARYEADRSAIPIRLINLPELRELLIENYESMDEESRSILPLAKIYWPIE